MKTGQELEANASRVPEPSIEEAHYPSVDHAAEATLGEVPEAIAEKILDASAKLTNESAEGHATGFTNPGAMHSRAS